MTDPLLRLAIATTLDELAAMLSGEHAALAGRVRRAHDALAGDPSEDLPDATVRLLRRLTTGTMGAMSDVTFGSPVQGLWVPDDDRERRFRDLSRAFKDQLARLPSSRPPDLCLVTDRVREGWLVDAHSSHVDGRTVEVQPPIWTGPTTTSEYVVLRGGTDDGGEVEITVTRVPGDVDLGRGRVFTTREAAEAARQ